MSLEESEQAAAAVAKTPNRVSLADIEANLDYYEYVIAKDAVPPTQNAEIDRQLGVLTLCIAMTRSGFTLVGKSAPADPENFDANLGKKLAYEDVLKQLWPLMGFALREKLSEQ